MSVNVPSKRALLVLKVLILALEELADKERGVFRPSLGRARITQLALTYGKGINLELYEVEPWLTDQFIENILGGAYVS